MSENHRAGLTKVVIHQSLTKPMLLLGGERTLVIFSGMVSGYLGYLLVMRYSIFLGVVVGAGLWLGLIGLLQRMARADPQMWDVLKRAKKYKAFYPARGRMDGPTRTLKDFN